MQFEMSMKAVQRVIEQANDWVWGPPLLILFVFVGVYLTFRTRGIQFRYLWYAHRLAFSRQDRLAQGDISHFQALMTALAATIGIGSITGVATAVLIGGMGALFWMWCAALIGMATKYGEAILAVKYRVVDELGEMCGGPMYYIRHGMQWKKLAALFAVLGVVTSLGTGNMVQANAVALALHDLWSIPPFLSGILLTLIVGGALVGGIKSIGRVASVLVPAMALFYIIGGLLVILARVEQIPAAFALILRSAFTGEAAMGGFMGATVMKAIQLGISRGVFSSEAGLGSSPIAAAAAKTDTPGRQALVSMCSVFITTGIVCTITGLAIAVSGVFGELGSDGKPIEGSAMALQAFARVIPYGGLIVTIALIPFAYSTILGWAYYGEKCLEYLFGYKTTRGFRVCYTLIVMLGATLSLDLVWGFANVMNGLMAFPNLLALCVLSGVIAKETRFFEHLLKGERQEERRRKRAQKAARSR